MTAAVVDQWRRVDVPTLILTAHPGARAWQREVDGGHLTVLRTLERDNDAAPWRIHLSISHRVLDELTLRVVPGRYPTWDEQREAVWRFAPGRTMASLLPPEGPEYVNVHPTTFHWWEVEA